MSDTAELIRRRERLLGPGFPIFYDEPLHLVRGQGVWLFDADGRRFLDAYNNVAHVGHCHPRVVEALAAQAATLNTHTRYLHETILDYAERLLATFDPALDAVRFTCTGTEANELALRIARACTGGDGVIVTDCSYHGNSTTLAAMSPRLVGEGALPPNVRAVRSPDSYRAEGNLSAEALSDVYAGAVGEAVESLQAAGFQPAAMLVDTVFSTEGLPDVPSRYLDKAVQLVRDAGGLFIADEVQAGFGRTGTHMWGYTAHGVVPDIATLGKPMGNGHPLAGLVTRAELLERFGRSNRYFNTFGGNPVSCAVGLAVLEVLEDEHLVDHAREVGDELRDGLRQLASTYPLIGDVRGSGLFVGVDLVVDAISKAPATELAAKVVNGMRERGVLLSRIGHADNVLKIRPPMPFSAENAKQLVEVLDATLLDATLGALRSSASR